MKLSNHSTLKIANRTNSISEINSLEGEYELHSRDGGIYVLIHKTTGRQSPVYAIRRDRQLCFQFNGRTFTTTVVELKKKPKKGSSDLASYSELDLEIRAQFPGKIKKLPKTVGEGVASGDVVAIMEAMKMEFNLSASIEASIFTIHVEDGAQVQAGQLIVTLKPLAKKD